MAVVYAGYWPTLLAFLVIIYNIVALQPLLLMMVMVVRRIGRVVAVMVTTRITVELGRKAKKPRMVMYPKDECDEEETNMKQLLIILTTVATIADVMSGFRHC